MRFITLRLKYLVVAAALLAFVAVGMLTANAAGAETVYFSGARSLPIYCVDRDDKKISISFDCAW
ncbi:MAG: deacetylase, partial [Clostridia bacterium]|nr:deacetylase [Clostridia bacterium]